MATLEERRDHLLEILESGDLKETERLIWRGESTQRWFDFMAPVMESVGDRYAKTNKDRAVWAYEQAKALFETFATGATNGSEGRAAVQEAAGSHVGKKLWLLRT